MKTNSAIKRATASILAAMTILSMFVSTGLFNNRAGAIDNDKLVCSKEEHKHSDECYPEIEGEFLICSDNNGTKIHTHDKYCYDTEGNLQCHILPVEYHKHSIECSHVEQHLVCDKDSEELHIHSDDCYIAVSQLAEYLNQSANHVHTAECYTWYLTCTKEDEDHIHSRDAGCFTDTVTCGYDKASSVIQPADQDDKVLFCGKEIGDVAHTHADSCYKNTIITCEKEDTSTYAEHQHTEECWSDVAISSVPDCNKEEHVHNEECYEEENTLSDITVTFKDIDWQGNEITSTEVKIDRTTSSVNSQLEEYVFSDGTSLTDCIWYKVVDGEKEEYTLSALALEPASTIELFTYSYRLYINLVSEDYHDGEDLDNFPTTEIYSREGKSIQDTRLKYDDEFLCDYDYINKVSGDTVMLSDIASAGLTENVELVRSFSDNSQNPVFAISTSPSFVNGLDLTEPFVAFATTPSEQNVMQLPVVTGNTTVHVNTQWVDEGHENMRPRAYKIQLIMDYMDYKDPITLNTENNYSYTWNDLPDNHQWQIQIVNNVTLYLTNISVSTKAQGDDTIITSTVTNTYTDDYAFKRMDIVAKIELPEEITGSSIDNYTLVIKSGTEETKIPLDKGTLEYRWDNMPYDSYTCYLEDLPSSCTTTVDTEIIPYDPSSAQLEQHVFNIHVFEDLISGSFTLNVNTSWVNDLFVNRPDSYDIQLLRNGQKYGNSITLTRKNNYSCEITNLSRHCSWSVVPAGIEDYEAKLIYNSIDKQDWKAPDYRADGFNAFYITQPYLYLTPQKGCYYTNTSLDEISTTTDSKINCTIEQSYNKMDIPRLDIEVNVKFTGYGNNNPSIDPINRVILLIGSIPYDTYVVCDRDQETTITWEDLDGRGSWNIDVSNSSTKNSEALGSEVKNWATLVDSTIIPATNGSNKKKIYNIEHRYFSPKITYSCTENITVQFENATADKIPEKINYCYGDYWDSGRYIELSSANNWNYTDTTKNLKTGASFLPSTYLYSTDYLPGYVTDIVYNITFVESSPKSSSESNSNSSSNSDPQPEFKMNITIINTFIGDDVEYIDLGAHLDLGSDINVKDKLEKLEVCLLSFDKIKARIYGTNYCMFEKLPKFLNWSLVIAPANTDEGDLSDYNFLSLKTINYEDGEVPRTIYDYSVRTTSSGIEKTEVLVNTEWEGEPDISARPNNYTVRLFNCSERIDTVYLNSSNSYSYTNDYDTTNITNVQVDTIPDYITTVNLESSIDENRVKTVMITIKNSYNSEYFAGSLLVDIKVNVLESAGLDLQKEYAYLLCDGQQDKKSGKRVNEAIWQDLDGKKNWQLQFDKPLTGYTCQVSTHEEAADSASGKNRTIVYDIKYVSVGIPEEFQSIDYIRINVDANLVDYGYNFAVSSFPVYVSCDCVKYTDIKPVVFGWIGKNYVTQGTFKVDRDFNYVWGIIPDDIDGYNIQTEFLSEENTVDTVKDEDYNVKVYNYKVTYECTKDRPKKADLIIVHNWLGVVPPDNEVTVQLLCDGEPWEDPITLTENSDYQYKLSDIDGDHIWSFERISPLPDKDHYNDVVRAFAVDSGDGLHGYIVCSMITVNPEYLATINNYTGIQKLWFDDDPDARPDKVYFDKPKWAQNSAVTLTKTNFWRYIISGGTYFGLIEPEMREYESKIIWNNKLELLINIARVVKKKEPGTALLPDTGGIGLKNIILVSVILIFTSGLTLMENRRKKRNCEGDYKNERGEES